MYKRACVVSFPARDRREESGNGTSACACVRVRVCIYVLDVSINHNAIPRVEEG